MFEISENKAMNWLFGRAIISLLVIFLYIGYSKQSSIISNNSIESQSIEYQRKEVLLKVYESY